MTFKRYKKGILLSLQFFAIQMILDLVKFWIAEKSFTLCRLLFSNFHQHESRKSTIWQFIKSKVICITVCNGII